MDIKKADIRMFFATLPIVSDRGFKGAALINKIAEQAKLPKDKVKFMLGCEINFLFEKLAMRTHVEEDPPAVAGVVGDQLTDERGNSYQEQKRREIIEEYGAECNPKIHGE